MIADNGYNTRVLLTIVSNPQSIILPHSLFYRYFSAYGEVFKILIFEKGKQWKCFIEMANEQQARVCKQQLNGCQIYEHTFMNVYFSTLQSVTFVNNNSGGIDYRQMKSRTFHRSNTYNEPPIHLKQQNQFDFEFSNNYSTQNLDQQVQPTSSASFDLARTRASSNGTQEMYEFGKKVGTQDSKIQLSLEFIAEPEDGEFDSASVSPNKRTASMKSIHILDQQQFIEDHINYGQDGYSDDEDEGQQEEDHESDDEIRNAFSSEKGLYNFSIPEVKQMDQYQGNDIDPYTYVSPQFLRENQPSKVVYIRGLTNPNITPLNLFNLLSNCGNVMAIILIQHKTSSLVQFEKLLHAQNALDHLNNQTFFGQKLKIFYSNYQEIQFPLPFQSPQTLVYIPNQSQFRFSDVKSISFNPPSQTLHLSNIKSELCEDEKMIRDLFKGIGTVQAIKFIHIDRKKHMVLVRLQSIEEALIGAALLHGKDVMGRKINVSFTKSKLC